MFQRCHFRFASLLLLMSSVLWLGCGESVKQVGVEQSSDSESETAVADTPPVDLATQPATLPEKDASAKEVCESFLGLLAQGERSLAEKLLTPQAFRTTVAAGLELQAMGDPGTTLNVGEAAYATSRAIVAQVPCTVKAADGPERKIEWLMRHTQSGWRIAGLIMQSGESSELLSLENKADVESIVKSRGGESSDTVRLVSATDEE